MDYFTASTFRDTMNVSVSDVGQDEADHDDDEDDQDVPHAETDTLFVGPVVMPAKAINDIK